jgi:hypothetical protein
LGWHTKYPKNAVGKLSQPIYSEIYPIEHLGFRLVNDTANYLMREDSRNVSVAPLVDFGSIALGLALFAKQNNTSYNQNVANGFWNYYYQRYASSNLYTPYARSINLFAIAGFETYGCNSTVENFTRRFIGNTSGSSIEEYGWASVALYHLYTCTGLGSDKKLYNFVVESLGVSHSHFLALLQNNCCKHEIAPNDTFEFGETASGLMLGGLSFSSDTVISAMNAVYQSNVSGTIENRPYHGDLANTETLPAYMLSTWLFQSEMKNATGYWISSLTSANITSISYWSGNLVIVAYGNHGSVSISSNNGSSKTYQVNGLVTIVISQSGMCFTVLLIGIGTAFAITLIVLMKVKKKGRSKLLEYAGAC